VLRQRHSYTERQKTDFEVCKNRCQVTRQKFGNARRYLDFVFFFEDFAKV
jgi:hypothetical protein